MRGKLSIYFLPVLSCLLAVECLILHSFTGDGLAVQLLNCILAFLANTEQLSVGSYLIRKWKEK